MQQKHKLGLRWLTRRQTDGKRKAAKKRGFPRHETVSMYIYIHIYIYIYTHNKDVQDRNQSEVNDVVDGL